MKKSNQELIQQKNNDSELECKKCNKGSSWLWAFVVFANFVLLAGIFHLVWNLNLTDLKDSQNTAARKLEEISNKIENISALNSNKVEPVVKDQEVELLEKAANKYHVAMYSYRILEKFEQDQDALSEIEELGKFEKYIENKSNFQDLRKINFSDITKNKVVSMLEEFEKELNNNPTQDESWLGNVKKRIGDLVKIEQKELLEKNKAITSHLQNAKLMLEINDNKKALESVKSINDTKLKDVELMLEARVKTFHSINQILREAL